MYITEETNTKGFIAKLTYLRRFILIWSLNFACVDRIIELYSTEENTSVSNDVGGCSFQD